MMKRYLPFVLIGTISGLFLRFLLQAELEQATSSVADWTYWAVLGLLLAGVAFWISTKLDATLGWADQPGRRWLAGWFVNTIALALCAYAGYLIYAPLFLCETLSPQQELALLLKGGVLLAFLVLSYTVVYFAIHSYRYWGQLRLKSAREERQRLDLQWQSLQAQLQPHFLFNSLNTISALVEEDEQRAETFIRKLAHTNRFSLESYEQPLILLSKEMKLVASYFYLLQTRYPDSLFLELDLAEASRQKKVPPLALQLLVENAVKHNTFSTQQPLRIRISSDDQNIWVQNEIRPRTTPKKNSFALGLDNLRARYELLGAPEPQVSKSSLFTVTIPLLS